jgi:superfamily II DNA or RNA helicase
MRLRPYQFKLKQDVYAIWNENPRANVLVRSATGSGKTVVFADIIHEHQGASVAIAHRQELVSQISLALARNGVQHRIIGPSKVRQMCIKLHMLEIGRNYIDPGARCAVAGIDTLIRMNPNDPWLHQVTLGVQDEAHHMLRDNKWGKGAVMFPNARWLGVTATPMRADGKGLGRSADGIMDNLVLAPSMRDLIGMGYLTDYRIYAPPSDIDLTDVPVTASGDFSPNPLRKAVHRSHITGDIVEHYLRLAPGKLGVTFAVDVESATQIAAAFNAAGVPAAVVHAETPDDQRAAIIRRFRDRQLRQLVNVDLFGEGFDLPAIEVVSFGRPTQSFPLFAQQFGRSCRIMLSEEWMQNWDSYSDEQRLAAIASSGKTRALIIDHVGNVFRHGLPDAPQIESLERRDKRSRSNVIIPVRTCPKCAASYQRVEIRCPYCLHVPEPQGRSAPDQVDGDLMELTPEVLERMRGAIDAPMAFPAFAGPEIVAGIRGHWYQKKAAQEKLREMMSLWCGYQTQATSGEDLRKAQKKFYLTFGVDVMSAQALARKDAEALTEKIRASI